MGFTIFIIAIVIAIIGFVVLVKGHVTIDGSQESIRGFGVIALVIAVGLGVLSCLTTVPARNQGVVTAFGQIHGSLDSGLGWKAPWEDVTMMDATVQTDEFAGENTDDSSERDSLDCISVRIADGSSACVSVILRSQIAEGAADELYPDFKHSDKYGDNVNDNIFYSLTRTNLYTAVGNVFSEVNPILEVAVDDEGTEEISTNVYAPGSFNDDVEKELETLLNDASPTEDPQVVVTSLNVTSIKWSDATEQRISQLQEAIGKTRIAEQDEETAEAQARAADALQQALSDNPQYLTNKCLDQIQQIIDNGSIGSLPIGYQCLGDSEAPPVIVSPK